MDNNLGWIKLHRSLKNWEWYDDIPATRLLIHLLITVNHEPKKWKGILVEPGTRITSFQKLAEETGLTVKQVRLAMSKLEKSGEVARERAREGQAVTLVKWEKLQDKSRKRASKRAEGGQAEGKERATTKEHKEIKNDKEVKKSKEAPPQLVYPFDTDSFKKSWALWVDYRKTDLKKPIKSPRSEQMALKKLGELANQDEKTAILIIEQSIANGYQGLFALKTQRNGRINQPDNAARAEKLRNIANIADKVFNKRG